LAHFPVFPPTGFSLLALFPFKVQTTKKPTSHLAGKIHNITKMSSTADIHGTPVRNGHNGHHHHSRSRSHSNRNRNSNSRTLYHEKHQRSHLSDFQKHLVAASGEFAGTFLFLYFAYAGNIVAVLQEPMAARDGSLANSTLMYIAMAYGFSLLVNVWAFFRISGGLFNPAVS
jgi:aquaporin related protein